MHNFTRNLLTEWRKLNLPFADETFVVAVSGGADSLALALALADLRKREKLNLRFVVAHFNHKLRGAESDADEEFVRNFTVGHDFELALGRGENIRGEKGSLEQAARVARYDFLKNTAESLRARAVLTAHTMNDQAETFLMNLIRGSGVAGLSGMRPVRILTEQTRPDTSPAKAVENQYSESKIQNPKSKILLVRPLLSWAKREDTERFCHDLAIEFRYDTMNEDLAFRRVRIRRVLLPLLRDFNPKIVETLANTANLLREEFEELEKIRERNFSENENGGLKIKELKNLASGARRRVLRAWLETKRGDLRGLDLKHVEAIENLVLSRKSGKTIELPGNRVVVKSGGRLEIKSGAKN
jgi:tRNA(Ile)-lysidine synthase